MNYPTTLDDGSSLPNPSAANNTNSPSHAGLHDSENLAIIAIETKIGIGSSTPVANRFLWGTGSGTSAWTQLTSSQLASSLTDETGSGSAVFANTPTLVTPKVDTINESTPSNGVTVAGLNLKSGVLNTNNSVVTANITDANVTAPKMNNSGTWNSSWAWQSWSPTVVGFSAIATSSYYYTQIGKTIFYSVNASGTSNSATTTISLPVNGITTHALTYPATSTFFIDNGVTGGPARVEVTPTTAQVVAFFKTFAGGGWTAAGTKEVHANGFYEVA